MTVLRYHIHSGSKRRPYYNTPQQIHSEDELEYRVVHDDRYPEFYYHLEHRRSFYRGDTLAWNSNILNLEDHISSCHFILAINTTFNTEFICADAEWKCTDQTIPCEVR